MFLAELNEKEKEVFWSLVNTLVWSDGIFVGAEREILGQYLIEMNENYEIKETPYDNWKEDLDVLKDSTGRIKKIIFFELMGAAYADNDYSEDERKLMDYYCQTLGINKTEMETLEECMHEIFNTYKKLGRILNE